MQSFMWTPALGICALVCPHGQAAEQELESGTPLRRTAAEHREFLTRQVEEISSGMDFEVWHALEHPAGSCDRSRLTTRASVSCTRATTPRSCAGVQGYRNTIDFEVHHIAGIDNPVADALSRLHPGSVSAASSVNALQVAGASKQVPGRTVERPAELAYSVVKTIQYVHSEVAGHRGVKATVDKLLRAG
jgi:hypothetical protein